MTSLPTTMVAAVLTGHGGLEMLEYRTDLPIPDESDAGWSGTALTFPRLQGADVAGGIVDVGSAVDVQRMRRGLSPLYRKRLG